MSDATLRVRRLGYGLMAAGLLTLGVVQTALPAARTAGILIGFLALAALVLERTQGTTKGFGFGMVTALLGVLIWPRLGATEFAQLGRVLLLAGALNAVAAPLFARLQMFGEGVAGTNEDDSTENG